MAPKQQVKLVNNVPKIPKIPQDSTKAFLAAFATAFCLWTCLIGLSAAFNEETGEICWNGIGKATRLFEKMLLLGLYKDHVDDANDFTV